jgi:aryl-alcohol dehydrogenase-like predicted oxidoreductase
MVKTLPFGDIQVPSPGFGAMGLSSGLGTNLSLDEAEPVLLKAIELGCTFWDTAVSAHIVFLHSNSSETLTCSEKGCVSSRCQ